MSVTTSMSTSSQDTTGFPNIWGNPRDESQQPATPSEFLEASTVEEAIAECNVCRKIARGFVNQCPDSIPLYFHENKPGAIGLTRILEATHFDENEKLIKFLDKGSTKSIVLPDLVLKQFVDIFAFKNKLAIQSELYNLLKRFDFLHESVTPNDFMIITECDPEFDKSVLGEMYGKPIHNPNIKKIAFNFFNDNKRVHLIEPLNYGPFVWLLKQSHIILTDSGGIQEEAPSLGKPVLVLREVTERPEAVKAGTVILVGSNKEKIRNMITLLLDNHDYYNKMASINNPYGDGKASERIINNFKLLLNKLSNDKE